MSLYPNAQLDALKARIAALEALGAGDPDFSLLVEVELLASAFTDRVVPVGEGIYPYSYIELPEVSSAVRHITVLVSGGAADAPPYPPHIILPPSFRGMVTIANLAGKTVYSVDAGFNEVADPVAAHKVTTSTGSTVDIGYIAGTMLSAGGLTSVLQRLAALEAAALNQPPEFSVLVEPAADPDGWETFNGDQDLNPYPLRCIYRIPMPAPGVRHITVLLGDLSFLPYNPVGHGITVPSDYQGTVLFVPLSGFAVQLDVFDNLFGPKDPELDGYTPSPSPVALQVGTAGSVEVLAEATQLRLLERTTAVWPGDQVTAYEDGEISEGQTWTLYGSPEHTRAWLVSGVKLLTAGSAKLQVAISVEALTSGGWEQLDSSSVEFTSTNLAGIGGLSSIDYYVPGNYGLRVRFTATYEGGAPATKAQGLGLSARFYRTSSIDHILVRETTQDTVTRTY